MKFVNNIDFKYYKKKILDKVTWKKIAIYLKFYSVGWYQARLKGYLC